jgi:hypothetical protein
VNDDNQKIGLNNTIIATILSPHSLITGPPGLNKFEMEVVENAVVQNCSPYAIWIDRNDSMGFAEHHNEEKISEKLDERFLSKLLQEISINSIQQNKSHLWIKEEKRNTSQSMPMSITYLQTTSQDTNNLSSKQFVIVSVDKTDLVRIKNVHKIHLKDNVKTYRKQLDLSWRCCLQIG